MPVADWQSIQGEIPSCRKCREELPDLQVDAPPGQDYIDCISRFLPSSPVRILFIGVAPPERGQHFYNTTSSDRLRRGLFNILRELSQFSEDASSDEAKLREFSERGFFFLHMAKCARQNITKPSI